MFLQTWPIEILPPPGCYYFVVKGSLSLGVGNTASNSFCQVKNEALDNIGKHGDLYHYLSPSTLVS